MAISASAVPAVQDTAGVPRDPPALGFLELSERHPDGLAGRLDFERAFTVSSALARLEQTRGFLVSFRTMTDRVRRTISRPDLDRIGNTGAEMQTIRFHNVPLVVEGTLLKQQYQLAQARYELAELRLAQGRAAREDVEQAREAYASATIEP